MSLEVVADAPVEVSNAGDIASVLISSSDVLTHIVSDESFSDLDVGTTTYTATLADGSALSTVGLSFDAATRTLSGNASEGTYAIKVTGDDGTTAIVEEFNVEVVAPVVTVSSDSSITVDTAAASVANTQTTNVQYKSSIATLNNGEYVIAWESKGSLDGSGRRI